MSENSTVWFAIKHLEIHDGPGVRTTLFLKGCSLSCQWCHNPESLSPKPQLAYYAHKCERCGNCARICPQGAHVFDADGHHFDRSLCVTCGACEKVCEPKALKVFGKMGTPQSLLAELLLDKPFYDATGGGVTVSGGEPLLQADFVCALADLLRENGVGLAIDTSLAVPEGQLLKAACKADILLCDIKAMNPEKHKRLTGQSNEQILANFKLLDRLRIPIEIRVPIIPGQNDDEVDAIAAFVATLHNVKAVKALAYHDYAKSKYEALAIPYRLADTIPPSPERLGEFQELLDRRRNV